MPIVMQKWKFEYTDLSKNITFLSFLDYQDSDEKNKTHYFSKKLSSSSREVLFEQLMEEIKFGAVEKYEFGNLDKLIDNIFGISDQSRMGSKEKTYAQRAQC